jgi:hypothetical protein
MYGIERKEQKTSSTSEEFKFYTTKSLSGGIIFSHCLTAKQ